MSLQARKWSFLQMNSWSLRHSAFAITLRGRNKILAKTERKKRKQKEKKNTHIHTDMGVTTSYKNRNTISKA